MMLLTTSRESSKNAKLFAKKLAALIPDSLYLTRGKKGIKELVEIARLKGYPRICIVTSNQGNPSLMRFIDLNSVKWNWAEELKIKGVYLSREKQKANSTQCTKELQKLFNVESDEESVFKIEKQENQILFKKGNKILIKIKLKEWKNNGWK